MRIYTQRLLHDFNPESHQEQIETLALNYDTRQKSRFRVTLGTGEDIGVDLPRTGILRGGAYVATEEGNILQILAALETLYQVKANTAFDLLKAAYHLGNRHVPLMLTPDALYLEPDDVLADMVRGLGLDVTKVQHPFEPESGAYAQHHHDNRLRPYHAYHAH